MGEHHREDRDYRARDYQVGRARTSRSQTVRSRSRRSRSQTVRSRTTTRSRYYQLPTNLNQPADPPAVTPRSRARHRLARAARHSLARAGFRVVRPRGGSSRLPTPIEALLPWGPVLVGIGILIGLMISVFVVPASNVSPGLPDLAIPPAAPDQTEPPPDNREEGPRYLVPEAYEVQYSPLPPSPTPSPSPPPAPPAAVLAGAYELEEVYHGVFIGALTIANESAVAGDWTVELAYGRDVGRLNTFWVDGTPQPTLDVDDGRLVFTSAVDVPARSSVVLKLHFDKSGFDISPKVCTVNGDDCDVRDPWSGHG
jgi:hypothetical protein